MSQNEQEKAFIDQKSAEYTRRLVAAVPKTDAELRDFAKEMLGQIPKNTPETDLFIEGWRRAFSRYHELLPGIKKVSDILVKELGDPQSVTDIDQLLADLPDQLKEAEAWLSSKKRATKDSREKVNRVVGIAGNRYRQEALAELRQREENLLFNIWPEYKQYVAWRDANPTITSGSPQDANYLNTLNARFAGMNNAVWKNPNVSAVFQQAYDLERLVKDKTATPENINNRLNQLRQASDAAKQGISEVQIVYWRLHSQIEQEQKKRQSMLTAEDIRQLKEAVRPMSNEIDNFNTLLEGLQLALFVATGSSAGTAPQNLLFIDPENREQLEEAYAKVAQAPMLSRLQHNLNVANPGLADRFNKVINQLLREAQVLLGEYTGDYQDVFPGDAQLEAWLFSENQEYFERFEEVRDLYDRVVVANNDPVVGDSDRVDFLLEYFAKQIDQLDRSDRAFNRRFITLDIQVNNLKAVRKKLIAGADTVAGVSRERWKIHNRPEAVDYPAWRNYYENIRLDYVESNDPDGFRRFLKEKIDNLEAAESNYSKQQLFSRDQEGIEYQYLVDYLNSTDLASSSEKARRDFYEQYARTEHIQLRNRLLFITYMGPYGESALGSGDYKEWFKLFPEFSIDDFHYWWRDFRFANEFRWVSLKIENYMEESAGDFVRDLLEDPTDENGNPIPLEEFLKNLDKSAETGQFSFATSKWMSSEGEMHKKLSDRIKAEFLSGAKRTQKEVVDGKEVILWEKQVVNQQTGKTEPRTYSDAEVDALIRQAYSAFVLIGGRTVIFMKYLAVGISPPPLYNMSDVLESYPIVSSLSSAAKGQSEIYEVEMGAEIPAYFFESMGQKIGIFRSLAKFSREQPDVYPQYAWAQDYVESTGRYRTGIPVQYATDGTLLPVYEDGSPAQYTADGKLVKYKVVNDKKLNLLGEKDVIYRDKKWSQIRSRAVPREKVLRWMIDDKTISPDSKYTRFRTLLIYYESSRLMSKALGIEGDSPFHLVKRDGSPARHYHEADHLTDEADDYRREHEINLPSLIKTPYEMVRGAKSEVFAKNHTRVDKIYGSTLEFAKAFHQDIMAPPPKLKGGWNHQDDIKLLAGDFAKCLAHTSKLKSGGDLVNWDEVKELYVWRLRVLFAAFKVAYPGVSPSWKTPRSTKEQLSSKENWSLVETFCTLLSLSGQTNEGMRVDNQPLLFVGPYVRWDSESRSEMAELLNSGSSHDLLPEDDHVSENTIKKELTMKQFLIDFASGVDSTKQLKKKRSRWVRPLTWPLKPVFTGASYLKYTFAAMGVERWKGDLGRQADRLWAGGTRLYNLLGLPTGPYREYLNFRRSHGVFDSSVLNPKTLQPGAEATHGKASSKSETEQQAAAGTKH